MVSRFPVEIRTEPSGAGVEVRRIGQAEGDQGMMLPRTTPVAYVFDFGDPGVSYVVKAKKERFLDAERTLTRDFARSLPEERGIRILTLPLDRAPFQDIEKAEVVIDPREGLTIRFRRVRAYEEDIERQGVSASKLVQLDENLSIGGLTVSGDGECERNGDAGDALHIHLTTGHIGTAVPIFRSYAAGGRELDFNLRYDSIRAQENGPLGWGWTHSYNIYVQQVGNKVIYHEGNGRRNAFTWNGSSYTKTIGRSFQLVVVGDDFELLRTNGTKEIFSPLDGGIGRITQIVDRRGRTMRCTYNGSQLTQVVSPHGRSVTIEGSGGRIWRITDSDNKVTAFEYWPGGELKKITDPLLHAVQYEYDGQRPSGRKRSRTASSTRRSMPTIPTRTQSGTAWARSSRRLFPTPA